MYCTMSRAVAFGPVGQPIQVPQICSRFSLPLSTKSSKYFSKLLSNCEMKYKVGPNSELVPTNQRAVRINPSSVVASEKVNLGGFQNSRKASTFVNFTRSASGF